MSCRLVPPDAPFANVIEELQIRGGFVNNSFHARLRQDGKPVKTCTSYFKLQQVQHLNSLPNAEE